MPALALAQPLVGEVHQQDRVLRHQAHQHDDADDGEDVERGPGDEEGQEHADQRERQRRHDGERLQEAAELRGEDDVDEDHRHAERGERGVERLLHVLLLAGDVPAVTDRQWGRLDEGFDFLADVARRPALDVGV